MKWLATLARVALLLIATLVLGTAAVLFALEESGRLTSWVRGRLAAQLGEPISIRSASLSWTDAAIEIEGLSLGLPERAAEFERVRVVWREGRGGLPRIALIEVEGGRVLLSETLQDELARRLELAERERATADQPWPAVVVSDLQLDLRHPAWGEIPIGRVRGAWTADASGRPRIEGRLAPSLADPAAAGDEPAELYLSGEEITRGEIDLALSSERLPFSLATLPPDTALEDLRRAAPHGLLTLDAHVQVRLDALMSARGEVRARLEGGALRLPNADLSVEGLRVDLQATCTPGPGLDVASPEAWEAVADVSAAWRGARIDAWGALGSDLGQGLTARAWLRAHDVPLERSILATLEIEDLVGVSWDALEPKGSCDLFAAVELPRGGPLRSMIEVGADGDTGITYHGWPSRRDGRRHGFPMPTTGVHGSFLVLHDPARTPDTHLAMVDVHGVHGADLPEERSAWFDGQVTGPTPEDPRGEWALRYGGQRIPIDGDGIPTGLAGLHQVDWIWPTFQPVGGEASFSATMQRTRDDPRLRARFDIEILDSGMTWDRLPLPVSDLSGHLTLLFAPFRSWGAAFSATGRTLTSDAIRVAGRLQRGPRLDDTPGEPPEEITRPVDELLVEFDNVALRGVDRDSLVERFPEIGKAFDQLAPSGKVDVRLSTSAPHGEVPASFWVETTPRTVRLSPQAFRVQTTNVRGRGLISGRRLDRPPGAAPDPEGASGLAQVRARLQPLVGDWPGEVLVAAVADLPSDAARRVELYAAGVDPLNRGLVGALREVIVVPGSGFAGLDLSALSVGGRVDLAGRLMLPDDVDTPSEVESRVYLRDNDFTIAPPSGAPDESGFGLDKLNGVLVQREGVLSGSGIGARLGQTPLLLREAQFSLTEDGYRLETRPEAIGLPLDAEHLRFFLDPETVEALVVGLHFDGRIDLEDAVLELSGSPGSGGRVRFAGRVRPRPLSVHFGLPLLVDSATVQIESLVFERDHVRAWAGVSELSGSLAGRRLEDASMQLTYVEPHLSILALHGTLEGGTLADLGFGRERGGPAFSIDLLAPFPFDLGLRLDDVRVDGLLRGLFESEFASRGDLDADLRLTGSLEEVRTIRGDGSLDLRDSTLWAIPVMRALFSQLGFDDTAVFESMRTRFAVRDGVLDMTGIQVYSPLLQLVGAGTLDFEGRLHHDLEVRYGLVDNLGPINLLVYWIQNSLLSIAVRGDMSRPRVELEGFLSVFQRGADRGRDLPLPALSPLPERF